MRSVDEEIEPPLVVLADNQNYCDGIPVFEVHYPETYKNERHVFTLFQIVESEKLIFETSLSRNAGFNGSYFCVDKRFVKSAKIAISYGSTDCGGSVYDFILDDFENAEKK